MLREKVLYSLRDISIIPSVSTSIKSRKECNPWRKSIEGKEGYYPLIASSMDSVMDETNWRSYWDNKISCVLPRTIDFESRLSLGRTVFCAFSLRESEKILETLELRPSEKIHVLIDIANGSMQEEIDLGKKLKEKFGDSIILMGGNIGNPQTYLLYDAAGFDFLRCGVGSGNGCIRKGTKVKMATGEFLEIEKIKPGDIVETISIPAEVLEVKASTSDRLVSINSGAIVCTPEHLIKLDSGWTEAGDIVLGWDRLKKDTGEEVPIEKFTVEEKSVPVYDLVLGGLENSYIIEGGWIVHNCLTSTSTAIHFPYASLISEISEMKYRYHSNCKIIADGGMAWYSDIIKALALGADYVMCGRIFAQAAKDTAEVGSSLVYRGMSTKEAQAAMGNKDLKTAEGRSLEIKKEYTLSGWTENFDSYLRSAMSYCDSRDLREFREKAVCQVISPNAASQINDK